MSGCHSRLAVLDGWTVAVSRWTRLVKLLVISSMDCPPRHLHCSLRIDKSTSYDKFLWQFLIIIQNISHMSCHNAPLEVAIRYLVKSVASCSKGLTRAARSRRRFFFRRKMMRKRSVRHPVTLRPQEIGNFYCRRNRKVGTCWLQYIEIDGGNQHAFKTSRL